MSTTVRLSAAVRDQLKSYKNDRGMTYDGAILDLLEQAAYQPPAKARDRSTRERNEDEEEGDGHGLLPDPDHWYREGANGATDFIMTVVGAMLDNPQEHQPGISAAVWDLYAKSGVEPRTFEREGRETSDDFPDLSDLLEELADRVENPDDHIRHSSERVNKMIRDSAAQTLQVLSTYETLVGNVPLESERDPELAAPPTRTYQGERRDNRNIVTIDGDEIDVDVSWGYNGTGPSRLARVLLADAYDSERFARARASELYNNCTNSLPNSWELRAEELGQYLDQR